MGNLSHTVGGTDNLVSFKSSTRVPIDSLKVHFSPIQEGEGDPSPENVRPIRGWNEVEIYRDGDKKTRQVTWNQWCKPLNDENWRAYNTANNDIQFENGIATSIWLQNKSGYNASIRLKTGIPQRNKEVWYVSYMVKPSISGLTWGVEYNGGRQHTCAELVGTDTWTRCSDCDLYYRGTNNYVYISYCRSSSVDLTGLVTQTKAPLLINLTQMFGYGNEPSKEEFETQCLLNGIDLTEAFPYDEGHVMEWKTSTANIKYHIPISVPEKNLFNIDAPYAEPSNTDYGDLTTLRTFQPYTYCIGLKYANIYYPTAVSNFSCSNGTISFTTTVDKYFGVCYAIPLSYGTYTITYTANNATADISLYDKDGAFIENHIDQSTFTVSKNSVMAIIVFRAQTIDIPSTVSDVQIVEGAKTIEYKSFDPDNAVYGGYVDLVKGEVVAEYGHYTFSGSEKDSITYYDTTSTLGNVERHRFRTKILDRLPIDYSSNLAYANIAKPNSTKSGDFLFYIGTPTNQILLYIKSSMCEPTVESFNAWLSEHPLQLVYKLKDPIHYPLTSTQLKTFLNNNAFWSNTNDVTEVSYAIHDAAPIRAARKRIMAASPHLETTSGGLVNFNTDVAAPLKECKIEFKPKQDLHGYDRPWVGGAGKNLFNENAIIYGTWTNADGSIRSSSPPGCRTEDIAVNPGETYTAMYNGEQPYSESLIELDENKNFILRTHMGWQGTSNPNVLHVTLTENTRYIYLQIYHHDSGTNAMTKDVLLTYRMQLEKGSVATSYEPYENICPIEGWNQLEIYRTNKNLILFKKYQYLCDVDYYNGYSGWVDRIEVNNLPKNVNLIYGAFLDCTNCAEEYNDNRVAIWIMQNNGAYRIITGNVIKKGNSGISSVRVTLYDTDNRVAFGLSIHRGAIASNPIVEVGGEVTEFTEYDSAVIPITFQSEVGTIYGGYVDLVNGEIVQEWEIATARWGDIKGSDTDSTTGYYHGRMIFNNKIVILHRVSDYGVNTISNVFNRVSWNGGSTKPEHYFGDNDSGKGMVHLYADYPDDTVIQVAAKLFDPIHYPIDPQTLKTLRGTNNIWSTSNGPISIKYWKH